MGCSICWLLWWVVQIERIIEWLCHLSCDSDEFLQHLKDADHGTMKNWKTWKWFWLQLKQHQGIIASSLEGTYSYIKHTHSLSLSLLSIFSFYLSIKNMAHHPYSLMVVKKFVPIFANLLEFNGSCGAEGPNYVLGLRWPRAWVVWGRMNGNEWSKPKT